MSDLGPQNPIETALLQWLVEQGYVSYGGLHKVRLALTEENAVMGFPIQLFEAREELLTKVNGWLAEIEERVRRTNREAGLGDYNDAGPEDES